MKQLFIQLIAVVLGVVAVASAQDEVAGEGRTLGVPVTLSLSTADFLTPGAPGGVVEGADAFSSGDLGYYALGHAGGFATAPARTWEIFSAGGLQSKVVPLPEPSSETALYFLSGAVGAGARGDAPPDARLG